MATKPLSSRPLDLVYFIFFLAHIPATLLVDLQTIYPSSLTPTLLAKLPRFYVDVSQDPLIGGAMGYFGDSINYAWLKSFLLLEATFQLPVFVLGMRGLFRDSKSIYVLLLIYAASTTTTTLACLAVIFATPSTTAETIAAKVISITPVQRLLLLSSYIPFFVIPLLMTVDMALRVLHLLQSGVNVQKAQKGR